MKLKPKVGIAFTCIEGFNLDQDKLAAFEDKAKTVLKTLELESIFVDFTVKNDLDAKKANEFFRKKDIDLLMIIVGVWTPDSTAVNLLNNMDIPAIVFTTSLSPRTIGINGGQVIVASLEELGFDYQFIFGDIDSDEVHKKITDYSFAAAIVKKLKKVRIGLVGGNPEIMLSLGVDSFSVKNVFGPTVAPIDFYKIGHYLKSIDKNAVRQRMAEIKNTVGKITVSDEVLEESVNYFFAFRNMASDMELDALTVNCFPVPDLKGKTCLAASNLNDMGIVTGCEGDVNATIAMLILNMITGRSSLNSDIIVENIKENSILFSHCGAGPFTCASDPKDIRLDEQCEVESGMSVYYPVKKGGKDSTIINLVGRESTYRLCILNGISVPTQELIYIGNPIQIRFKTKVVDLINQIGNGGFGHHWMVSDTDCRDIFLGICKLLKINRVTTIE